MVALPYLQMLFLTQTTLLVPLRLQVQIISIILEILQ